MRRYLTACLVMVSFSSSGSAQERLLEFGNVSGQPGELVEVPVFATIDHPALAVFGVFLFDPAQLEFLGFDVRGSEADAGDLSGVLYRTFLPTEGVFGFDYSVRESTRTFSVPAGTRRSLGHLKFRVRAAAAIGESALTLVNKIDSTAGTSSFGTPGFESFEFELQSGSVTVLEPQGPRPVGDLVCEQFLDTIRLTFTPTETYDGIEVRRDGDVLSMLAGDATSFDAPLDGVGLQRFELIALRGDGHSMTVGCDVVATSPTAPVVVGLACSDEGSLSWQNPVAFDRIFVFKDGREIAVLDGTATNFADPAASDAVTVYTLITELSGFRSPETSCIANGTWIIEVGDVLASPASTRVSVPVYATHPLPLHGFQLGLDLGSVDSPLKLVREVELSLLGTVSNFDPEFVRVGPGPHDGPAVGVLFDFLPPSEPEKDLPPGLRQHVFNWVFDIEPGTFRDGDVVDLPLISSIFTVRPPTTVPPDSLINGQIRFGAGAVAAVENLNAELIPAAAGADGGGGGLAEPDGVRLSWTNGGDYDSLEVLRNGEMVARLAKDATEFVDTAQGAFTYKVVGMRNAETSFPRSVFVSTITPPGAFLRGDTNRDRNVDLSDAVATLMFLFVSGQVLECADAADANDDGKVDIADPIYALNFLFASGPAIRSPGIEFPWFDPTPDNLRCDG